LSLSLSIASLFKNYDFLLSDFPCFSESPQKHLGPVWQLQWIEQDRGTTGDDKREILVSISADGRISKWVIRKGLDCHGKINKYAHTLSFSHTHTPPHTQIIFLLLCAELKIPNEQCIKGDKFRFD